MIGHEDTPEELKRKVRVLQEDVRILNRDLQDWKLRFRDRDAYCRLLEAELLPYRREFHPDMEQEPML